jgi:hypothetical protein
MTSHFGFRGPAGDRPPTVVQRTHECMADALRELIG